MTEYNIAGEVISIPTDVENERYVKNSTSSSISQVGDIFDSWYSSQYDCNSVYKNAGTVMDKAIMPIIKKGVQMISDQGVYSINEDIFLDKYIPGFASDFFDALETMQDEIEEIEDQKQLQKEDRQARKAGRGRAVGGGFGLGGALKGMATAGMINATTGMAHSLGNTVGNMGSSLAASSSKSAIYKNSKAPLRDALIQSAYNVQNGIRTALEKEANVRCKFVTVTESNQAEAIIQSYKQNRIPDNQKKKQIIQALILDPYETETYEIIWNDYGDKNGELRKVSTYFGGSLEQRIKEMAEKYGNEMFSKNCQAYINAFNKTKSAIQSEQKIKETVDTLQRYCTEHDIEENLISNIEKCKSLLKTIDVENRTVKGQIYNTRDEALQVKGDYEKFYRALSGKNVLQTDAYELVSTIQFSTNQFRENFKNLCEKECILRTPEHIFANVSSVLGQLLGETTLSTLTLDIPGIMGTYQQKENMVRTITTMPIDEVPILLCDRSRNGKSGVMFTNSSLRIFAKGIFSNDNQSYPIELVETIECIGDDEYSISIRDSSLISVNLKQKKLSPEEQIAIGNTLNEVLQVIKNIVPEGRGQLYRILYGVAICTCGMHLLQGEKICPSCNRMIKDNSECVETQECPNCKNLIPVGKKFCSICGTQLFAAVEESSTENNVEEIIEQEIEYVSCPSCGESVKKGKKFCTKCGSSILPNISPEDTLAQSFCPNCGNIIKQGKKFCLLCGTKIQ